MIFGQNINSRIEKKSLLGEKQIFVIQVDEASLFWLLLAFAAIQTDYSIVFVELMLRLMVGKIDVCLTACSSVREMNVISLRHYSKSSEDHI